ncbi:DUF3293 domain-containing protein [Ralstonia solanacearum]|uniref:DUF3293 domain-containing protein n=1 Tax=Ralstonia solanacearum K60 TaxID=1091042 RepID=A0AAP7ZJP4_RALSL|nr:DUF3293 domain-containing protein [Ralstonia solanacearum]MBT1539047.1 DUF3293 domain-containing protein [Ralstonia solanacearum]OYQ10068.1 hypothetical protein B7R77_25175 [Ralstonia solanacearum K60]QOK84718.1 DUF3293 domain-containing protein [Ralstonia solanacearum]
MSPPHRHPPAPTPALIAAYRRARYRVAAPDGEVLLRIDAAAPGVAALLARAQTPWAVFVTACQPFSHPVSAEENAARQTELLAWAIARGLSWLEGEGGQPDADADTTWPPEPSLLLFIDDPAIADTLMLNFEQNAVVMCDAHGFCTLRWHPYLPF